MAGGAAGASKAAGGGGSKKSAAAKKTTAAQRAIPEQSGVPAGAKSARFPSPRGGRPRVIFCPARWDFRGIHPSMWSIRSYGVVI